jgi:hypothetical protein
MNFGPTITIPMPAQNERTLAFLRNFPDAALPAIGRAMNVATQEVLSRTIAERLVTKGPNSYRAKGRIGGSWPVGDHRLGPLTHDLHTTMTAVPATIEGNTVRTAIGSPVPYWFAHEYGFTGRRGVRAHTRRYGKRGKKSTDVVAHERDINIPARAPVNTGIAENIGIFEREINAALRLSWSEG